VVIRTATEGDRLERCLSQSPQSSTTGGIEVIYVDSLRPTTAGCAAALGAPVIEVRPERPCAGGRNAGWRAATAPFVLFLDGDTILAPDSLNMRSANSRILK